MGRATCPHCGGKIVIRHTLLKSEWYDGRGKNPNSHNPSFDRQEMYQSYLDGVPKTELMEKYGVGKRRIDQVIKDMRNIKPDGEQK
jgi:ssDNA-binding Zn-finger/Zn-ribbon topoisomerase 1